MRLVFVEGAVRRNRLLNNPTNADIETQIKLWLRQSCDNGGGRWERERKKKDGKLRGKRRRCGSNSAKNGSTFDGPSPPSETDVEPDD